MVWPIGHVMIYGVVWRAWLGKRYGLVGRKWYIYIGLARYGMVYVIVWWGLAWYGLSGMTQYILWPGEVRHGIWYGHGMLYGMAWRCLAWYRILISVHGIAYGMA